MAESNDFDLPVARTGAAMTVVGNNMLVWGGFTQEIEGDELYPLNIPLPDEEDKDYDIDGFNWRAWHYIT